MKVAIKENSIVARFAAFIRREKQIAIVTGNVIHLWNTKHEEFLQNKKWLRHELAHVLQYHEHGYTKFIALYLWECIKNGYHKNKFEKEARLYENETTLSEHLQLI